MSKNVVLEVKHLTKEFDIAPKNLMERFFGGKKKFRAVNNISFKVYEGEILGLLGPNGAGKTTTLQMLMSIMIPSGGEINIFGMDLKKQRSEILKFVNFSSSYVNLPWRLTVNENLTVFGKIFEVENLKKRIDELLNIFEAADLKNKKISHLSAGQRTRIMLCKAMLNRPKLLFLDEPTASLDPDLADKTRKYILDIQKKDKMSVLFTSHNMTEIEEVCDRVIFLNHGKIIAEDTPQNLVNKNKKILLKFLIIDGLKRTEKFLRQSDYKFTTTDRTITVDIAENDISMLLNKLAISGVNYSEINITKPDLEDYFLEIARGVK